MMPDIMLASTKGGMLSLAQIAGTAVVYIYPWTGGPGLSNPPRWDDIAGAHGSTPETEGFRDLHGAFGRLGVAIFGVSSQSSAHQGEFAQRLGVPFALLSDEGFVLQRALELPVFETGGVLYLKRLTLILSHGRIRHTFYPVHPPDRHAQEVLDWLRREEG
jgi:peroxiredoxin